ncbi:ABC transporter ATP-binding protein [Leifsonia sp. ZF2019]|uniref:ATP-binding cassette domain-containing protein n=1 Tax=Leifsonia sp. ZF2019 TaxID=2781978 RepID=UPI001CBA8C37|nr:ABC transporter ATP-binding protein [Leifsonia sp. ZF2019]UAJ80295.1 ABC transporter ATP-binding protein [Leifsonia sp. ZF2019]
MREIGTLIREVWKAGPSRFAVGTALLLVSAIAPVIVATSLKRLVEATQAGNAIPVTLAVLALASAWAAEMGSGRLAEVMHERVADAAHDRLHARLIRVLTGPVGFERRQSSSFQDSIDVTRAGFRAFSFAWYGLLQSCTLVVQILASTMVLVIAAPGLAWFPVCAALPVAASAIAARLIEKGRLAAATERRRAVEFMRIAFSAEHAFEVRGFGLGPLLNRRFTVSWKSSSSAQIRGLRSAGALELAATIPVVIIGIGVLASFATSGGTSLGNTVLVVSLVLQLATQALSAGPLVRDLFQVSQGLRQLAELERVNTADAETAVAGSLTLPNSQVELTDIAYRYPGADHDALHGINLSLRSGEMIALVGANGAGKSTLVGILSGLLIPTNGTIHARAADRFASTVFQSFSRPGFRLIEDVAVCRYPDLGRYRHAIATAGAEGFESALPKGAETFLGREYRRGVDLSGGQWQRVAIARATYHDAGIAVFDEPDSALDAHAERALFEHISTMSTWRDGRPATRLLVTHRLTSAPAADRIVLLEQGRVVAIGTHQELIAGNSAYRQMYDTQSAAFGFEQ